MQQAWLFTQPSEGAWCGACRRSVCSRQRVVVLVAAQVQKKGAALVCRRKVKCARMLQTMARIVKVSVLRGCAKGAVCVRVERRTNHRCMAACVEPQAENAKK